MKKLISIVLLAVFMLTATDAYQLLKMPYVFKHFDQHQRGDRNLSVLEFLDMHYLHGTPNDTDYDEDMKLPFKSANKCPLNQSTIFVLPARNSRTERLRSTL